MFNAGKNILRASKTGTSQLGIPLLFVIPAALCNPILSHFLVCKHVTLCNPFFGFFKVPCEIVVKIFLLRSFSPSPENV